MFASVLSAVILGMEVYPIQVEADVSDGLPSFTMVGFPSAQVKEAQDRVRTALKNNGIALPPKRITVNLAPADIKKQGAGFDVPVAASILAAAGIIKKRKPLWRHDGRGIKSERRNTCGFRHFTYCDPGKRGKMPILHGSCGKYEGSQACAGHEGDRSQKYEGNGMFFKRTEVL